MYKYELKCMDLTNELETMIKNQSRIFFQIKIMCIFCLLQL